MEPHDEVYVSTACLSGTAPICEKLASFIQVGFYNIELGVGVEFQDSDLDLIKGLPCRYLLHNYFPPPSDPFVLNLASPDPRIFSRSLGLCERAIQLSAQLGGAFYSVHGGLRVDPRPEHLGRKLPDEAITPYEASHARLVEALRRLCDAGDALNVKVATEPNVVAGFNLKDGRNDVALLATPDELTRLRQDVQRDNFGFLIDTGHLKVTAATLDFDPVDFIERAADSILGFHLSDNDGVTDQHCPFGPDAWFLPILRDFPAIPRILECRVSDITELLRCRDMVL